MLFHITVTEDDIRHGEQFSPTSCPVALAVDRELSATFTVSGFGGIAFEGEGEDFFHVDTPQEVTGFIQDFDAGCEVKPPAPFSIEVPERYLDSWSPRT